MPDNRQPQNRSNQNNAVPAPSNAPADNLQDAMWRLKIQDKREAPDAHSNPYPHRPGEPDCLYYMRTGLCGYGSNCRYNHPAYVGQGALYRGELPERAGQPDCQYFLKTGLCKFGATCKYHHPRDRLQAGQVLVNSLGLPMRQEEKSCAYYMRTGSCKFGIACKFHHPEPSSIGAVLPLTGASAYGSTGSAVASPSGVPLVGGIAAWSLPRPPFVSSPRMQGIPGYMPLVVPSSQSLIPGQQGWSTYTSTANPVSSTDAVKANHMSNLKPHLQPGSSTQFLLPDRPDQPECQYFLKTGNCKYGPSCKYHHPKEKIDPLFTCTIGLHGLPLRPGQAMCTFYSTYGSCRYGSACKYDHPFAGYYSYTVPTLSISDPSALFPYQRNLAVNWISSGTSPSKALRLPDGISKPEGTSNENTTAPEDPPQTISPSQTAPSSESLHDQSD